METTSEVEALKQEIESLRETNRRLHRRVQEAESQPEKLRVQMQMYYRWQQREFERVIEAHSEIQLIWNALCTVYEYPQKGQCLHSLTDYCFADRLRGRGVYANCLLDRKVGGIQSFRVADEVKRLVADHLNQQAKQ